MMSSLTIKDIEPDISAMLPVMIYIDGELVWKDISDDLASYYKVLDSEELVYAVSYQIVEQHHSIVKIITNKGAGHGI
jgi:hypothetical protein